MTHLKVESAATVRNEQSEDLAEVLADLHPCLKLKTEWDKKDYKYFKLDRATIRNRVG